MNNKIKKIVTLFCFTILGCVFCTACAENETTESPFYEGDVAEYIPPENTVESSYSDWEYVTEESLENVPDVETMTEEEFYTMDYVTFKSFVKKYIPEFREVYNIGKEQLDSSDWYSLRIVMGYNLFKKPYDGAVSFFNENEFTESETETSNNIEEEIVEEKTEENVSDEKETEDEVSSILNEVVDIEDIDITGVSKEDVDEIEKIVSSMELSDFREMMKEIDPEGNYEEMDDETLSATKQVLIVRLHAISEKIKENEN